MRQIFASDNAFVSAVTIILALFFSLLRANGLDVLETAGPDIVNTVSTLDFVQLFSVILPSILLPTFKFIGNGFPNVIETFKASPNFRTQAAVAIVGLFGLFGLILNQAGVVELLDTVQGIAKIDMPTILALLSALLHAINSGQHINQTLQKQSQAA